MVTMSQPLNQGFLDRIKNHPAVDAVYTAFWGSVHGLLVRWSPALVARHRYRQETGRRLPLERPVTFDEKLFWLMLYWRHPLKALCADKVGMRDYVQAQGYGHLLVDLVGVFERSDDVDFSALPDRFALKCAHGCGYNILCRDRSALDPGKVRRQLDAWMKRDYGRVHGEIHYSGIRPRILCERFLEEADGGVPADYKLNCFHGKVLFTTLCTGRGPDGHGAAYDHYDRDWQAQLPVSRTGLHPERWRPRPACYAEMVEAAEALSRPFPYVRMDFYCVDGRPLLGEMTFTPAACIDPGYTDETQAWLGSHIQLPEPLGP
jgi:hypothetical protein